MWFSYFIWSPQSGIAMPPPTYIWVRGGQSGSTLVVPANPVYSNQDLSSQIAVELGSGYGTPRSSNATSLAGPAADPTASGASVFTPEEQGLADIVATHQGHARFTIHVIVGLPLGHPAYSPTYQVGAVVMVDYPPGITPQSQIRDPDPAIA